jgi:hypothetical protein
MTEYKLPGEMPSLLGAGSIHFKMKIFPRFNNGVFKLDDFTADSILFLGYIYGGISSTALNIFFHQYCGAQSSASNGRYLKFTF